MAHERASEALRLKVQEKKSYREIAQILGFKSPASVYEAVQRLLKRIPQESIAEMRQMESEKLDRYEQKLDGLIFGDDANPRMTARNVEVLVGKIMERRAKMHGLDAADRVEHTLNAPKVIEYVRDVRQDDRAAQVQEVLEADYEVLEDLESRYRDSEQRKPIPDAGREGASPGSTDSGDAER